MKNLEYMLLELKVDKHYLLLCKLNKLGAEGWAFCGWTEGGRSAVQKIGIFVREKNKSYAH